MAQAGYTPIQLYYSTIGAAVPLAANLLPGELAINTNDGKLYYEDSGGTVQTLASKSTGTIGGSTTQIQFNNSGALGGSANLTWDGSNVQIGSQGDLRFGDSDNSNWVAFQAPATVSSNVTWTLPNADGTSGQVLSTNGTGTLSWTTGSGGSNTIVENAQTISTNYTISSGYNGMGVGAVTISTGVSVTVGSGQKWLIFG